MQGCSGLSVTLVMTKSPHFIHFPPQAAGPAWWKDQIVCGDSLAILRSLPHECIHLAITSPPYNVGLEYDGHDDSKSCDEYLAWLLPIWQELKRVLVPGGRFSSCQI